MSRAIVIGAGVSGVLTAYYLGRAGVNVTVIEASSGVATEASRSNGSQLSYSYVNPMGSPSLWKDLPKVLLGQDPALKIAEWSPFLLKWCLQMLFQSSATKFHNNQLKLLELSLKSQELMDKMQQDISLNLTKEKGGKLHLYHNEALFNKGKDLSSLLEKEYGIEQDILGPDSALDKVPDLSHLRYSVIGGIYSPNDEMANCEDFCKELYLHMVDHMPNVQFLFNQKQMGWRYKGNRIDALVTQDGDLAADNYIICAGSGVNRVLRPLKVELPILPVKGYTLVTNETPNGMGCSTTLHEHKVVAVPLSSGVRVSGLFHMGGNNHRIQDDAIKHLRGIASTILPNYKWDDAEVLEGLRPCTPSSTPIVGQLKYQNLFCNAGHGMLGWTLAHVCANKVANKVLSNCWRTHC